jgi:hypothetical protein
MRLYLTNAFGPWREPRGDSFATSLGVSVPPPCEIKTLELHSRVLALVASVVKQLPPSPTHSGGYSPAH